MMRRFLSIATATAVALSLAASVASGQESAPAAPRAVGTGRFAALSNELALYSPFESPWVDLRANHSFESHLFGLMRAEVRLWELQDALAAQNSPAREAAADITRIVHEQVLAEAAEALPLLQKTPNKAFAQLLVRQLEAYPYEWQEEGSEQLLPGLRKTLDPGAGKTAEQGNPVRRRRRRAATPPAAEIPVAPAVRQIPSPSPAR